MKEDIKLMNPLNQLHTGNFDSLTPYEILFQKEENEFLCPFFLFMKWKHANITKLCSYILQRFIIRQGCPYPSQRYQDCQHRKNRTLGWKRWRGKYYNFNIMYWYMQGVFQEKKLNWGPFPKWSATGQSWSPFKFLSSVFLMKLIFLSAPCWRWYRSERLWLGWWKRWTIVTSLEGVSVCMCVHVFIWEWMDKRENLLFFGVFCICHISILMVCVDGIVFQSEVTN